MSRKQNSPCKLKATQNITNGGILVGSLTNLRKLLGQTALQIDGHSQAAFECVSFLFLSRAPALPQMSTISAYTPQTALPHLSQFKHCFKQATGS